MHDLEGRRQADALLPCQWQRPKHFSRCEFPRVVIRLHIPQPVASSGAVGYTSAMQVQQKLAPAFCLFHWNFNFNFNTQRRRENNT
jgi:hypothetical protein